MFHKATGLVFKEGTVLELTFQSGEVKSFDVSSLFGKYPQLTSLEDRDLFLNGILISPYGIIWNDELDLEVETVYEEGELVRRETPAVGIIAGEAVAAARARKGISQKKLSELTGIDQSDISKIERGNANPSVATLARIAKALDSNLRISMVSHVKDCEAAICEE